NPYEVWLDDKAQLNPILGALQSMLDAPWSRRLWIVQESMVNDHITMQCGRHNFNWMLLSEAAGAMGARKVPKLVRLGQSSPIMPEPKQGQSNSIFIDSKVSHRLAGPRSLYEMIRRTSLMQCTNPSDKIYALLGVATDAEQLAIRSNYGLPV